MRRPVKSIAALLMVGIFLSIGAYAEKIDPKTHDVIPEPDDLLYNHAPDPLPWIDAKFQTVEYWVSRMDEPDTVILDGKQIAAMNEAWQKRLAQDDPFADEPAVRKPDIVNWWPGWSLRTPDLTTFNRAAVADTVRVRIRDEIDYLYKRPYGNALAITYSDDELKVFEEEMALDAVPASVAVKSAITVRPTRLRNIPSFFPMQLGLTQSRKTRWDQWNIAFLNIGKAVQVLHVSKSGEYLFVFCKAGYGWVRAENVAFGSKNVINEFVNDRDFVIATKGRVLYYGNPSCTIASGWLGLGSRLPISADSDPLLVKVPVRKMDGSLEFASVWMPKSEDVHVGFVPYTRRNIISIAFKQLGDTYDWSGAWFGRQHERAYSDVFACFGFDLPNHGTLFTFFNDRNTKVLTTDMGKDAYIKAVAANEPFVTIQSCGGHCQLYIGDDNGRPLVFDQHGYGYPDENDVWHEVRRTNVGDMRLPRYFFSKDVTFLELR